MVGQKGTRNMDGENFTLMSEFVLKYCMPTTLLRTQL